LHLRLFICRKSDAGVDKIDSVLEEWGSELKSLYRECRYGDFYALKDRIITLINARRKITSPQINDVEKASLLRQTLEKIDEMKRVMGLDMVVKNANGEPADESNTGINELLDMHVAVALRDRVNMEEEEAKTGTNDAKTVPLASTSRYRRLRKKREQSVVGSAKPIAPEKQPYQILIDFKTALPRITEDTSVYFSLFSKKENKFITEMFVVNLTVQAVEENKVGRLWALITDVLQAEMKDLFLVCRMVRFGKLLDDPKSKEKSKDSKAAKPSSSTGPASGIKKEAPLRRPYAVGVLALTDNIFAAKGDSSIPLFKWKGADEVNFATLHEAVIKQDVANYESLCTNANIVAAINRFPLDLAAFQKEYPEHADTSYFVRKLAMPESIDVGDTRNDIYMTLDSADFPDLPSSGVGVEITVTPRLDRGPLIPNSIVLASCEKPRTLFKSWVMLGTNQPVWKETLRLQIPATQIKESHLNFTILAKETKDPSKQKKGASERESFGFGYIKLTGPSGAVIANGTQDVQIYRNPTKTVDDMTYYLKESLEPLLRKGNKIVLKFQLSSAVLTQNDSLLKLLDWKNHQDDLENLLKKVTYIDHMEILKFLREIFDAMFAILEVKTELAMQVYDALVFIIGILVDEKASGFSNYRSVLDSYIVQHFQGRTAHKTLLRCLQFYLSKLESTSHAKFIRDSMRALDYLFRFIVSSNILYQQVSSVSDADREEFLSSLMQVLDLFNQLMSQSSRTLIGAQTIALKNFSAMLHELSKIFEIGEIAKIACTFLMSIPQDEAMKQLNLEKLNLMHELVSGAFYQNAEARSQLMPTVVHLLALHMEKSEEELIQCIDILGTLLDTIQLKCTAEEQPLCVWELVPLLQQLTISVVTFPHDNFDLLKVIACATSFYNMMVEYYNTPEPYVFNQFLGYIEDAEDFLKTLMQMADVVLERGFPSNWFTLQMFSYYTMYRVFRALTPHLTLLYSEAVWKAYFSVLARLLMAPSLQIEKLPLQKQTSISEKYLNLRMNIGELIVEMWQFVQTENSPLLQSLVIYLVDLATDIMLSESKQLSELGLSTYLALLRREFELNNSIERVLSKTTDNVHKLIDYDDDGAMLRQVFLPALEKEFTAGGTSDVFRTQGTEFMHDLQQQIDFMTDLRNMPSDPAYDDERVNATMRLMNYLREKNKIDAFVRNLHVLIMQQLSSGNFAEAANSIVLHSSLLSYESTPLDALQIASFLPLPAETMAARKERLVRSSVDFYDKAKEWERALVQMRSLEMYYESTYRYRDLSELLRLRATMVQNIAETERFYPEYFRVGYYGKGFASSIANMEFIYRGYELERLSDFTERIRSRFPSSELLKSTDRPGADICDSAGQHLLITPVNPSSLAALGREELNSAMLPAFVRKYQKYSDVKVFVYSKTFKKSAVKGVNEFADLWIRKIYMVTLDTFPSYSRSSRVVEVVEQETSPIENAVDAISAKNEELLDFKAKHSGEARINLNPFTMALNGVIDAAVNGGVNNYKLAFLTPEFLAANPDSAQLVDKLKEALRSQMAALQAGVVLHKTLVSQEMQGLQDHMEQALEKLKNQIQEVFS
jgi:dedicator of cytokinesis protein 1